jgi:peptidase E
VTSSITIALRVTLSKNLCYTDRMKLLLTSAGFINTKISEVFVKELPKPAAEVRLLLVPYAQNEKEEFYITESKQELEQLGIKNIVITNMHYPVDIATLGNFDVIYMCGGNTFAILKKLRETGLFQFVIDQVKKGCFLCWGFCGKYFSLCNY